MKKVVFCLVSLALTSGSIFAAIRVMALLNLQVKSSVRLADFNQLILRVRRLYWVRVQKSVAAEVGDKITIKTFRNQAGRL